MGVITGLDHGPECVLQIRRLKCREHWWRKQILSSDNMRKQKLIARTDVELKKRTLSDKSERPRLDIAAGSLDVPLAPTTDECLASNRHATLHGVGITESPRTRSSSASIVNVRRTVRRAQLRDIVPLADTTIYEMEQCGEFPRRFYLTPRCVVWDLGEVEAWIVARGEASDAAKVMRAPAPDVRRRRTRPVAR